MGSEMCIRDRCGPLADRRVDAAARREHCSPSACCCTNVADCVVSSMITKAAAGWSWGLGIKNLSFVVCVAKPSSLDMLVLVGEVRMQAGLHTIHIMLHKASW